MITLASETTVVQQEYAAWVIATDADKRDVVMIALNRGYVENDLQASFIEAMRNHMSDCRARYQTAFNMDLWLSQETAFGKKWSLKR